MKLFYAKVLAEELMYLHGLMDWVFRFDSAKKRFGCCHFTKKQITLSSEIVSLNSELIVKETILHEIAHALAGPKACHGKEWKEIVQKIGGNPSIYYDSSIVSCPKLAFTVYCSHCKMTIQRKVKARLICKKCRILLIWDKN